MSLVVISGGIVSGSNGTMEIWDVIDDETYDMVTSFFSQQRAITFAEAGNKARMELDFQPRLVYSSLSPLI
jgi:hypothetical protein